jgi:hypothetical protein
MTRVMRGMCLGCAVAVAVVIGQGAARAQLTKDEQKCIDQYNNKLRLVSQQAGKSARACIKNAGKGKESDPEGCLNGDAGGKIAGKEQKVSALYPAKCSGAEPIQQGATVGNQAHVQGIVDLTHDIFGDPVSGVSNPGKDEAKCQDKVIQRATQAFTAKVKEFRACKKAHMKDSSVGSSGELETVCMTPSIPDPKGKIGKKVQKLLGDVSDKCAGVAASFPTLFAGLDSSCDADAAALGACVETAVECRVCQTLNAADGMARNCDEFDDGAVNGSCAGGLSQHACVLAGGGASRIELNAAAIPVPLTFDISGQLTLGLGAPDGGTGLASTSCQIDHLDPIDISSIGTVCIQPYSGCELGTADCDGGSALGIDVVADGNVGSCTGNTDCAGTCQTYCAGIAKDYLTSGCTGYCTEGAMMACTDDQTCSDAGQGSCNGPDPVGSHNDICQCQCIDRNAFGPTGAGTAQCNLGATLVVENAAPCDGTDTSIDVGAACIPITTSTAQTEILHANFGSNTLGPFADTGAPIACTTIDSSTTTGLQTRGVVNFFGSALGDLATELFAQCQ